MRGRGEDIAGPLARVEAATGPDRELDRDLFMALVPCDRAPWRYWAPVDEHHGHGEAVEGAVYYAPHCGQQIAAPEYTASLDAVLSLAPAIGSRPIYLLLGAIKADSDADLEGLCRSALAALLRVLSSSAVAKPERA